MKRCVIYCSGVGKPNLREQEAYKCNLKIFVYFLAFTSEITFFVEIYKKVTCIMENILELAKTIPLLDRAAAEQATARQLQLTKPTGSLGRLEAIAIQMAGITGEVMPIVPLKAVIVMAADHGLAAEGVSPYPAAVTPQMVYNFLREGAAINALSRQAGAEVIVVDVGVATEL